MSNAHANGAARQILEDSDMRQEQSDAVAETGHVDHKPMRSGDL